MSKRLVICSDGTWNIPDHKDRGQVCPSNVAKVALAVASRDRDGVAQVLFYDKGVGTGTGMWDRFTGGAFGWGLSGHILAAYRFLIAQYEPGDQLFLFGFSRGAYTVRSLAGLIRNCGLLLPSQSNRISAAYELYRRRDDASQPAGVEAQIFRKMYAQEVRIRFIGVWDTVGALGIPVGLPWIPVSWLPVLNQRWAFHDVKLSSYVDAAYHAVAIDERRAPFKPTLWEQQAHAHGQIMEQVWFAGVHENVGGGYQDTGLSDLALLWLMEKAQACGLAIDPAYVAQTIKPNPLGELRTSRDGIYQLFSEWIRPIGRGRTGHEAVHSSAVDRLERSRTPAYRPPNLMGYLRHGGQVTQG